MTSPDTRTNRHARRPDIAPPLPLEPAVPRYGKPVSSVSPSRSGQPACRDAGLGPTGTNTSGTAFRRHGDQAIAGRGRQPRVSLSRLPSGPGAGVPAGTRRRPSAGLAAVRP